MDLQTLRLMARKPCFLVAFGVLMTCGPALAEKRMALVVGNSTYQNVPRLENPKNDARLMADALLSLGFALVGGGPQLDLDESRFRRVLQDFSSQLEGADVGLFYYAGHGVQVRGSNYLVPIDANPTRESDVDLQMLDTNVVLRQMEGAGTRLNLVILDACRNNPFGGRGLRAATTGLAQMRAPEGTLISFATQPGNVAQDGADGNSPYTKALVQAMRKPGLDVLKTFNEVGLAVASATGGAQEPWVSFSPLKGDFYFAGAPSAAPLINSDPCAAAADHWHSAEAINTRAAFEDHLARFPSCAFAGLVRARIEALNKVAIAPVPIAPGSLAAAANAYSKAGNFACFGKAEYPNSWRDEASLCVAFGCNFGKMSQEACLALGARKRSKTVIYGNTGTTRAGECWLQHSCGDLRPHGEFTLFRM